MEYDMLSLDQTNTILGERDDVDDVIITQPVADPTPESVAHWTQYVASLLTTTGAEGLDTLEAVLEATEREWFLDKFRSEAERRPSKHRYEREAETTDALMQTTGYRGDQLAEVMGITLAEAQQRLNEMPVSLFRVRQEWMADFVERHPTCTQAQLRAANDEWFVPLGYAAAYKAIRKRDNCHAAERVTDQTVGVPS